MEKDIPLDMTLPNPGPPLDPRVRVLPPAAEPDPQLDHKKAPQPVTESVPQQHPQECPQPALPQYALPAPLSVQQMPQQFSPPVVQPVQQVLVVQQMPTACPGQMFCPHCNNTVLTKTKHKPGVLTWIICGTLGFLGCWPCCIIPFFVDACKDVEHSCPNCNNVLHIYTRR